MKADVVIIGGGVIGASIARELSRYSLNIILIEKEDDVAMGTSKGNSGIIHAGYNADFKTLKGQLNIKSNPGFDKLCRDLKVRFKRIGSLVVGFNEQDLKRLRELKENGEKNGINNLEIIRGPKLFKLEPNLNPQAKYALYAPSAGIISPYKFTIALADNAVINGVKVLLEIAFYLASKEILRISNAVEEMVLGAMKVFISNDERLLDEISAQDMIVDNLSREITKYLTKISFETLSEEHSKEVFRLLYIVDDLEHIGDLVDKNLIPLIEKKIDHSLVFSEKGAGEIKNMHQEVYNNLRNAIGAFALQDQRMAQKVIDQKKYIDSLEINLRKTHINRLNVGIELSQKTSGVHLDLINILKRINDHSYSIARAVVGEL